MIDLTTAEQIVSEFINRPEWAGTKELLIMPEYTRTTPYGWVFYYDTAAYVKTRDDSSNDRLVGNVPILVEKSDGSIHPLHPSGFDIEVLLAEYEASRTLPVLRTPATPVWGPGAGTFPEAHLTLDQDHTLCGKPVPAVPPNGSSAEPCPECWQHARAASLVCPVCESGLLAATDPDCCLFCRLKRRKGWI